MFHILEFSFKDSVINVFKYTTSFIYYIRQTQKNDCISQHCIVRSDMN